MSPIDERRFRLTTLPATLPGDEALKPKYSYPLAQPFPSVQFPIEVDGRAVGFTILFVDASLEAGLLEQVPEQD